MDDCRTLPNSFFSQPNTQEHLPGDKNVMPVVQKASQFLIQILTQFTLLHYGRWKRIPQVW